MGLTSTHEAEMISGLNARIADIADGTARSRIQEVYETFLPQIENPDTAPVVTTSTIRRFLVISAGIPDL